MHCGICGYDFEPSELVCHAACPLGVACMVICCPRCGYSTVDPSRAKITRRLINFLERKNKDLVLPNHGSTMRLLDLKPGQSGHVRDMGEESSRLAQLSQYGLLPGTPISLIQKYPVPIVQVGQTDLALELSVAAEIFVDV